MNALTIKACSFFGHRQVEKTEYLKEYIQKTVVKLIEQGCEIFYFGGYGEFDDLCYEIVTELKQKYLNIKRVFCVIDEKQLNPLKRPKWLANRIYEDYVYFYLKYDYWYTKIYFRNCEIVNHSDFIVFYAREEENSGAYKIYKYARKVRKPYINLYTK